MTPLYFRLSKLTLPVLPVSLVVIYGGEVGKARLPNFIRRLVGQH